MASIIAVALLAFGALPAARPGAIAAAVIPTACVARFEGARDDLIARGFAPTSDKDTRRWLQVDASQSSVQLQLQMRTSADGPATYYSAVVKHARRGVASAPWRLVRRKHCCDEHASEEDHLVELVWSRSGQRLAAVVSVVEFKEDLSDPHLVRWRDMFVEAARTAADACLAAPG